MKLKKQQFSTSNIYAIISPIGLKRQNMFIRFLINTLHYNQMERKNVEILVHLTFKTLVSIIQLLYPSFKGHVLETIIERSFTKNCLHK